MNVGGAARKIASPTSSSQLAAASLQPPVTNWICKWEQVALPMLGLVLGAILCSLGRGGTAPRMAPTDSVRWPDGWEPFTLPATGLGEVGQVTLPALRLGGGRSLYLHQGWGGVGASHIAYAGFRARGGGKSYCLRRGLRGVRASHNAHAGLRRRACQLSANKYSRGYSDPYQSSRGICIRRSHSQHLINQY